MPAGLAVAGSIVAGVVALIADGGLSASLQAKAGIGSGFAGVGRLGHGLLGEGLIGGGILAEYYEVMPKWVIVAAVAAAVLVGGGFWVWRTFFDDYHFAEVQNRALYRDGFRTAREFDIAIAKSHARTVVSLLDKPEYADPKYAAQLEYLSRTRLRFINIPIKLGGYPTTDDVRKFLKEMEREQSLPVLVHCAQGIRRTGMMVAAYQLSILKWDKERAKAAILSFGHSERTIGDIKRFIDVYDPETREVTKDLGKGTE